MSLEHAAIIADRGQRARSLWVVGFVAMRFSFWTRPISGSFLEKNRVLANVIESDKQKSGH